MEPLGFKQLDLSNWLAPDSVSAMWGVKSRDDGSVRPISGDDYVQMIAGQIPETVPHEVRKLFEVARGALVYGYFFYPLFTLAAEQLFRVVEAAVRFRCDSAGAPAKVKTYEKRIEWLADQQIIRASFRKRLHGLRELRNESSHPEMQSIYPPGVTIPFIDVVSEVLEELFPSQVGQ